MAYFTNSQGYLFLCSDIPFEEKQKLDDYLLLLEESKVGKIIEESIEEVKKTVEEDNISDEEVEESKRTHQING